MFRSSSARKNSAPAGDEVRHQQRVDVTLCLLDPAARREVGAGPLKEDLVEKLWRSSKQNSGT